MRRLLTCTLRRRQLLRDAADQPPCIAVSHPQGPSTFSVHTIDEMESRGCAYRLAVRLIMGESPGSYQNANPLPSITCLPPDVVNEQKDSLLTASLYIGPITISLLDENIFPET